VAFRPLSGAVGSRLLLHSCCTTAHLPQSRRRHNRSIRAVLWNDRVPGLHSQHSGADIRVPGERWHIWADKNVCPTGYFCLFPLCGEEMRAGRSLPSRRNGNPSMRLQSYSLWLVALTLASQMGASPPSAPTECCRKVTATRQALFSIRLPVRDFQRFPPGSRSRRN